jgi:hypothetical protein
VRRDRTWSGLPHYVPADPRFRQKTAWWRKGCDWQTEPNPRLTVTGRRLDKPAPPLAADHAGNAFVERNQPWMRIGIFVPTYGCWEITGHYNSENLGYVVRVVP